MTTLNQIDPTEQYKDEVSRAQKAQRAWDDFLGGFIADKKQALFDSFCDSQPDDVIDINIRSMKIVLDNLEQEIATIIETGKLAALSLEKANED